MLRYRGNPIVIVSRNIIKQAQNRRARNGKGVPSSAPALPSPPEMGKERGNRAKTHSVPGPPPFISLSRGVGSSGCGGGGGSGDSGGGNQPTNTGGTFSNLKTPCRKIVTQMISLKQPSGFVRLEGPCPFLHCFVVTAIPKTEKVGLSRRSVHWLRKGAFGACSDFDHATPPAGSQPQKVAEDEQDTQIFQDRGISICLMVN
ncbi:hypothetical protein LZ31DRAFT_180283 [Colletotrichum somersetense]|nr:hypothetical protein LZ31DRAFT_180283 [Colletotrichum somersetense]